MILAKAVTGLVLNYRDPVRTTACVQSLLRAGISRILVIDNSGACEGRMTVGHLPPMIGADVQICYSDRNLGFSAGVNRGLLESAARWPDHWILLVNNDALLTGGLPERLSSALAADQFAATASPWVQQDGAAIGWTWYQPWLCLITLRPLRGSFCFASGCCMLIATDRVWSQPFCEDFFMYGEDVDLAWQLAQRDLHQLLVDGCEVVHEGSASSRRGSLFYETLLVEAHIRLASTISRDQPARRFILLALRAIVLPSRAILRCLRVRSLAPLQGLCGGINRAFRAGGQGAPDA